MKAPEGFLSPFGATLLLGQKIFPTLLCHFDIAFTAMRPALSEFLKEVYHEFRQKI
jgi:hypothetical protein